VWALENYGFRVVLAPSFADIFFNNCFKNGVLPIPLEAALIQQVFDNFAAHPGYRLTVDLQQQQIRDEFGWEAHFQVDEFRRHCLLNGLDDIGLTLQHADKIAAYEAAHGIA
jgi:3-isopropylmalate/(R)-2-methylmalate dehydratase small subunit